MGRQLAEDIFGVAFDYDEFDQYDQKTDESESEDYDDDEMDEEKIRRKEKKKRKTAKTIFDIFDPHDLAMGHYTDQDHEIRNTDIPERMQVRQVPVTAVPEDSDELPDPERRGGRDSASRGGEGSDEEDISIFIVDEEGRPIERKKAKRKHIFEDSQRQLAEDIFGVAFDYDEFDQYDQKTDESESEDYDDDEMDEEKI